MALIKCPECEKEISDKASACIYCGFPLLKNEDNNSNQKLEKEDRFNIILNSNYNKIEPIKLIMELKGISLSDSKDIVDNCPVVIFENLSSNETENIVNKFMTIGSDIVTENLEESNIVRSERNAENKTEEITKTESIINTTDNNIKRNNKGCSVAIIITIVIIFLLAFLRLRKLYICLIFKSYNYNFI